MIGSRTMIQRSSFFTSFAYYDELFYVYIYLCVYGRSSRNIAKNAERGCLVG